MPAIARIIAARITQNTFSGLPEMIFPSAINGNDLLSCINNNKRQVVGFEQRIQRERVYLHSSNQQVISENQISAPLVSISIYTQRRSKFGTEVSVKGRREYIPVGALCPMPAPCWQSLCRTPRCLLRHCRNLKCERYTVVSAVISYLFIKSVIF